MQNENTPIEEQKIEPCEHMTEYLSAYTDETLPTLPRLFTQFHILHCSRCRRTISVLRVLRSRLHHLRESRAADRNDNLTPERRSTFEAALNDIDKRAS